MTGVDVTGDDDSHAKKVAKKIAAGVVTTLAAITAIALVAKVASSSDDEDTDNEDDEEDKLDEGSTGIKSGAMKTSSASKSRFSSPGLRRDSDTSEDNPLVRAFKAFFAWGRGLYP